MTDSAPPMTLAAWLAAVGGRLFAGGERAASARQARRPRRLPAPARRATATRRRGLSGHPAPRRERGPRPWSRRGRDRSQHGQRHRTGGADPSGAGLEGSVVTCGRGPGPDRGAVRSRGASGGHIRGGRSRGGSGLPGSRLRPLLRQGPPAAGVVLGCLRQPRPSRPPLPTAPLRCDPTGLTLAAHRSSDLSAESSGLRSPRQSAAIGGGSGQAALSGRARRRGRRRTPTCIPRSGR